MGLVLRCVVLVGLALAGWGGGPGQVFAASRHALVVGVQHYDELTDLDNPANDARAIRDVLADAGFVADLLIDPDHRQLVRALAGLSARIQPGDEVAFYFSGHGVELEGSNLMLARDTPAAEEGQEILLRRSALGLDDVLEEFRRRGARLSLVIIDACRDNPFPRRATRSPGGARGLAPVEPARGTFLMFAAGAGQTALDSLGEGDDSRWSVFTRVLLRHLVRPGVGLHQIGRDIRAEVEDLAATVGHPQFPAVYDEVRGDFILFPDGRRPALPELAQLPPVPQATSVPDPDPQGQRVAVGPALVTTPALVAGRVLTLAAEGPQICRRGPAGPKYDQICPEAGDVTATRPDSGLAPAGGGVAVLRRQP